MDTQPKPKKTKSNEQELQVLREFFEDAKLVRQMGRDGMLWRKVMKSFTQLDFDKVQEKLSKSK